MSVADSDVNPVPQTFKLQEITSLYPRTRLIQLAASNSSWFKYFNLRLPSSSSYQFFSISQALSSLVDQLVKLLMSSSSSLRPLSPQERLVSSCSSPCLERRLFMLKCSFPSRSSRLPCSSSRLPGKNYRVWTTPWPWRPEEDF